MIDFHTHILPGIDDGSMDIKMTEKMLEKEQADEVMHIYATPHFYANRRSVEFFLERRNGAFEKVRELLESRPELPKVTAGAEVYYFSGIGKAEHLDQLCIEGTDILLLEMPFEQWHRNMARDVDDIINRRGIRIVLAHVERYERFQKDRDTWKRILDMPLTIQLNTEYIIHSGSWLRQSKEHKFCMQMLADYDNIIIGTDCHNMTRRAPNLGKARSVIEKKLGSDRLTQIDEYTSKLLGRS